MKTINFSVSVRICAIRNYLLINYWRNNLISGDVKTLISFSLELLIISVDYVIETT